MSGIQDEVGPAAVTAVVSCAPAEGEDDGEIAASAAATKAADVHFEAFQVSAQCVRLNRDGWLKPGNDDGKSNDGDGNGNGEASTSTPPPSGVSRLVDPNEPKKKNPVIVAGKDASQVDNDYFLVPVPIRDHGGPLRSSFAVENRLLPQGPAELSGGPREMLIGKARVPPLHGADGLRQREDGPVYRVVDIEGFHSLEMVVDFRVLVVFVIRIALDACEEE